MKRFISIEQGGPNPSNEAASHTSDTIITPALDNMSKHMLIWMIKNAYFSFSIGISVGIDVQTLDGEGNLGARKVKLRPGAAMSHCRGCTT